VITYTDNTLKVENDDGVSALYKKEILSIPISLSELRVVESYSSSTYSSLSPSKTSIICQSFELDLSRFSRVYEKAVENFDISLSKEIGNELKVLNQNMELLHVKTSQLSFAEIRADEDNSGNQFEVEHRGFFTVFRAIIYLPDSVFVKLVEDVKNGVLESIALSIGLKGFDLGYNLGKKYSGVLIESEERFDIGILSAKIYNPKYDILSSLNAIRRALEERH
jgi:hypothetical protein